MPFARNLSYLGTGEDLRKATTHFLAHTLASTMDRVDAYIVGNWRRQARFKLQDDAVATSILGRLCEQFPEVFQTHVMPHLQDADLISLFLLGTSPQGVSPRSFQVLDRFVGVDPDGRAYCKMCRLKNGRNFGKTNLTTLPALRGHAERAVFRSGPCARRYLRLPPEAHGEMRDAIDAVLCRSS